MSQLRFVTTLWASVLQCQPRCIVRTSYSTCCRPRCTVRSCMPFIVL